MSGEATPRGTESNDVRQLREAIERKDAKIAFLTDVALAGVVHRAGYDPNAGTVKLVMEKFSSGEITADNLKPEAFTEFAKGYDVEPSVTPTTPQGDGTPPGTPTPPATPDPAAANQQQLAQLQAPADQLAAAAAAIPPNNPNDLGSRIAAAEAAAMKGEGSWDAVFALKNQQVPSLPDGFGSQGAGLPANPSTGLPTHTPT